MGIKYLKLALLLLSLSFCSRPLIAEEDAANKEMNSAVFRYHSGEITIEQFINHLRSNQDSLSDSRRRAYWDETLRRAIGTRFVMSQPKSSDYIHLLISDLRRMTARQPFGPGKLDIFWPDKSVDAARLAGVDVSWDHYSPARKLVDIGEHALPILKQYQSDETLTMILIEPKRTDGFYGLVTVGYCVESIINEIRRKPPMPQSIKSTVRSTDFSTRDIEFELVTIEELNAKKVSGPESPKATSE